MRTPAQLRRAATRHALSAAIFVMSATAMLTTIGIVQNTDISYQYSSTPIVLFCATIIVTLSALNSCRLLVRTCLLHQEAILAPASSEETQKTELSPPESAP